MEAECLSIGASTAESTKDLIILMTDRKILVPTATAPALEQQISDL